MGKSEQTNMKWVVERMYDVSNVHSRDHNTLTLPHIDFSSSFFVSCDLFISHVNLYEVSGRHFMRSGRNMLMTELGVDCTSNGQPKRINRRRHLQRAVNNSDLFFLVVRRSLVRRKRFFVREL